MLQKKLLAASLFLLCLPAFSQTAGAGGMSGTITDPSGSVVPDVRVTILNTATGIERTVTTNQSGIYSATFLQPGSYEVSASKTGFAKIDNKGLTIAVGQTVTLDMQLPLNTTSETVEVNGQATLVDPAKTEQSQSVSQTLVQNLPIVGRRWDNFVLLTPGVTTDGGLVSYRGISGLYNNNSVDGANNNQAFFSEARGRSTVPYTYSLDAIQEFQVTASNYSAEFGQAAGGVVNAVTKSGTNSFHADLFYYLRYPSLNALDSFNKSKGIYTQPVHQQQQFGGSAGGYIFKNKLFYFVNYDGSRKVFPIAYTSSATFPLPCPAVISAAKCAAANAYLASLTGSYPRTAINDIAFAKLDYQLNSSNRLSASFDFDDFHAPNSYNSNTTVNNNSVTANGPAVTHTRFFVASWDAILNPSTVNNFRFQWGLDNEIIGANSTGPNVSIASVMAYGMPNALPRPAFPDEHRLQFTDTISRSLGKHQLKAGVDVNRIHEVLVNLFQGGGVYSYSGAPATAFGNWVADIYGISLNNGKAIGQNYSSFAQVTDPITGVGRDDFYDTDLAGFMEDNWKVLPNFTLNLGARYEIQMIPQPPKPNTATPLTALYSSTINIDKNNIAPRIGMAFEPHKGTVLRAGYGIFYAKTSNSTFYASRVENGVYQQTFNCTPATCPSLTFPNLIFTPPGGAPSAPFPGALTPQVVSFTPPSTTQLTHGLVPDFVNPLVHEGELTLETQLPGHQSISAGYLTSRGQRLPVFVDANLAPATTTHTYAVLTPSSKLSQLITVPFYTKRLNPSTGVILNGYSAVNSWYNALVLTYHKPMSHGVEVLANYTFSRSIDDGAVAGANGTFYGTDWPLDPLNQRQENSLSDLDQRYRLVASVVYAPQFFSHLASRAARAAFDGFAFSVIGTAAAGQPINAQISGFPSGGVDYGVTGGEVTNTGGSTGGRAPQYGRNVFIGPGLRNVDLRIMREFHIVEKARLQFIGEAFNVFNHTNIASLNTTAFNYVANCGIAGANGCLSPNPAFLAPTSSTSTNGLYGARQLQFSAKLVF